MNVMPDLDPTVLILVVSGLAAVAIVTVLGGKRFVARWGKGELDAGGGAAVSGVKAGRDAKVRVKGPGGTVKDVEAGQDVDVSVGQK